MAVKKKANVAKQAVPAKAADDKTLAQVEECAMGAAKSLGMPQFPAWVTAYFHPYQAYGKEKKNSELGKAVSTFALIGLVEAVATIIMMALVLAFALPIVGIPFTIVGAIIMLIAYPITSVIGGFVVSCLYFVLAKVLGGKGSFMEQTYCMALVSGGVVLMMAPFNILQAIPIIGGIFGLAGLVVALYGIISQYRMIRAVHSLSQLRAIVVLVVPAILIIALIFFVIGVAAIAAMGAYGTSIPVQ